MKCRHDNHEDILWKDWQKNMEMARIIHEVTMEDLEEEARVKTRKR